MKTGKIFLALGAIVTGGLLLGMFLGRFSQPDITYSEPLPSARPYRAPVLPREEAREEEDFDSAFANMDPSTGDEDEDHWGEDPSVYRFDPDFEPGQEPQFAWPVGPETEDDEALELAQKQPPAPAPKQTAAPSSRYDSLPEAPHPITAGPGSTNRDDAPKPPAREPRTADGQLPAIW